MLTRSLIIKPYSDSFLTAISFPRGPIYLERYSTWFIGIVFIHLNSSVAVSSILLTDDKLLHHGKTQRRQIYALAGRSVWQGRQQLWCINFLFVSVKDLAKKTILFFFAVRPKHCFRNEMICFSFFLLWFLWFLFPLGFCLFCLFVFCLFFFLSFVNLQAYYWEWNGADHWECLEKSFLHVFPTL